MINGGKKRIVYLAVGSFLLNEQLSEKMNAFMYKRQYSMLASTFRARFQVAFIFFWPTGLMIALAFFALPGSAKSATVLAHVEKLSGELTVLTEPRSFYKNLPEKQDSEATVLYQEKFWRRKQLAEGSEINLKDNLQYEKSCRALIKFKNGDQLLVTGEAWIRIGETVIDEAALTPNMIDVVFGRVRAIVTKKNLQPEFRTNGVVVKITGTDFVIDTRNDFTNVQVIEGSVTVGGPSGVEGESKPTAITPGMSTIVSDTGSSSLPKPLTPADINELRIMAKGILDNDPGLENLKPGTPLSPSMKAKLAKRAKKNRRSRKANAGGTPDAKLGIGTGLQYDLGLIKNQAKKVSYPSLALAVEYAPLLGNFGFGVKFSILQIPPSFFDRVDFKNNNVNASALAATVSYLFANGDNRLSLDLNIGGQAKASSDDRQKTFAIGGVSLHFDSNLFGIGPVILRSNLGYTYRVIHSTFESDFILQSLTTGLFFLYVF